MTHLGYAATRVHWTDVGGGTPGSFNARVPDMYAEGLRIPAVRLFRSYEPVPGDLGSDLRQRPRRA